MATTRVKYNFDFAPYKCLGHHPVYNAWRHMRIRCSPTCDNPRNRTYRGIKVCDRWQNSFQAFADDMLPWWSPGLTLERRDVHGHYEPSNCTWIPAIDQYKNRTDNIFIELKGIVKIAADWSVERGLPIQTILSRRERKWPVEAMLFSGNLLTARGKLELARQFPHLEEWVKGLHLKSIGNKFFPGRPLPPPEIQKLYGETARKRVTADASRRYRQDLRNSRRAPHESP